jgi:hypothetical protein
MKKFAWVVFLFAASSAVAATGDYICSTSSAAGTSVDDQTTFIQNFLNQKCDKTKPFSLSAPAGQTWADVIACCIQK